MMPMASASQLTSPFFSQETASTNNSSQSSLLSSQASQPSTQPSRASSPLEPDPEADLDQEYLDEIDEHPPDGWTGYLSAQYQTHIVDNLKQTVFEKIDQLKASITSLQQNHASQEKASAASVNEFRVTHDQIFSTLRDLKPIPSRLSALEINVRQNKEQAGYALSNLDDKVSRLKTDLGVKYDGAMRGLKSVQQQNMSLLEALEVLQGKIGNLQQQQTQTNERLSSFQNEMEKTLAPYQGLSHEAMELLRQLHSRRADLMGLMDRPTTATSGSNVPLIEAAPQTHLPWRSPQNTANKSNPSQLVQAVSKTRAAQKRKELPPALDLTGSEPSVEKRANPKRRKIDLPAVSSNQQHLDDTNRLPLATAKKALPAREKRPSATTKQPGTTKQKAPVADMETPPVRANVQDMRLLFKKHNDAYKARPPKAEWLFIWKFINEIESPEKLKHLQERLLELLPYHISQRRASHRLGDKFIQISRSLTWGRFAKALAEV
ncbi:uncharacterized protein B0T23DRAFT_372363 [Neurospora hispaniola]|uniref:Uncharacterized protein n=1 Tax=Neurospora hispaniola TaxID=588809 RepID=A0AAJ0IBF1_9PEZI|nr:hypothetical protein B0T23DRAFT_372363 [Neurospora hispaniola]